MGLLRKFLSKRSATEPARDDRPSVVPSRSWSEVVSQAAAYDAIGRYADALATLRSALEIAPDQGELVLARARSLAAAGRYHEAREACLRALSLGQGHFAVFQTLGWACLGTGRAAEAEAAMRESVELEPANWASHYGIGTALSAMGRHDDAADAFSRAIDMQPTHVPSLVGLGSCHFDLGNFSSAEAMMRRAIAIDESSVSAWSNLAVALDRQDRLDEALEAYRQAERLERAEGAVALNFVGFGAELSETGDTRAALELYEYHLPNHPNPAAQTQYALALLGAGRLREGWSHLELRWLIEPLNSDRSQSGRPVWSGQDLRGKTVLLRPEQGHGDNIQFLRYAPALKALGATVFLGAAPGFERLARLFPGVDRVFESGSVIDFDYYIPLVSLARVMGTELDSIPADVPYVRAAIPDVRNWAPRFPLDDKLKVGLAWAGNPNNRRDRHRSLTLKQLSSLSGIDGVTFYSLQKGPAAQQVASGALPLVDLGPKLADYCDTAAVIEQMDLVICVDTSVAHLAGALGKPVWVLVPQPADWRWLEQREDSPWYPTMRLFRQKRRGDWAEVIERLRSALHELPGRRWQGLLSHQKERSTRLHCGSHGPALAQQGAAPGIRPGFCAAAETGVGILEFRPHDDRAGKAVNWYGEYLQPQLDLLGKAVPPGSVALEVGAGIGVHAVYLARRLGAQGHLLASEAHPVLRRILEQNLAANRAGNATVLRQAVGQVKGAVESPTTVDALQLERLDLLKVGEGVDASTILAGAEDTLWRLRPLLFAAAKDAADLPGLSEHARAFSYRCWKMTVPLFNPDNFNQRDDDIFAGETAFALLAIPEEFDVDVSLEQCTELS